MSECNKPMKVKKGDRLKIVANYDTATHPVRTSSGHEAEEMGIYFLTFVPDN
jgi:hypothetical protein